MIRIIYERGVNLRLCGQNKPVLHKAYKLKENKEKKLNAKTTHFSDRECLHSRRTGSLF